MADSDNELLTRIANGIDTLAGLNSAAPSAGRPSGSGAAPAGSGGSSSAINALLTNAGKLADQFGKILSAGIQLEHAWTTSTQQIGREAAGTMEMLRKYGGGMLANMGEAAINQSQQVQKNSNIGIGGGSFLEATIGLRKAGLTAEDYANAMAASKGALNNFGDTAYSRARDMSAAGDKLQQEAQRQKLTEQISQGELGKILLLSQMGRTAQLTTEDSQKKAAASAVGLADQINRVAISSGKSREAIEAELAERMSSAQVQAQLAGATEEQRQAIIASQASIAGMGKMAGDAAQEIQAGGRLSKESQMQLMSMGPRAMAEFMKGNQLMAKATTPEQRQAAQDLIDRAKVDTAKYQSTPQFQKLLQSAPDELRSNLRKSYEENLERGGINASQRQRAPGQTPQDAERERQQRVSNLGAGKTEGGQVNPQVAPQERMAELNNAAFNQANSALTLLNKEIVKLASSKDGIELWGKAITKVYGKDGDLDKSLKTIIDAGKTILGSVPAPAPGTGAGSTPGTPGRQAGPPKTIQPKAGGGDVVGGETYLVGENGPEIFKSKSSGNIVPNDKISSLFDNIKKDLSGNGLPTNKPNIDNIKKDLSSGGVSTDKLSSIFGDIKTKISSIGGTTTPPASSIPKFEVPKSEIPKIDFSKFSGSIPDIGSIEKARQDTKTTVTPAKATESPPTALPSLTGTTGEVTLKDIHASLQQLNKTMGQVAAHSESISQHSEKTAKMSAKATGNRTYG